MRLLLDWDENLHPYRLFADKIGHHWHSLSVFWTVDSLLHIVFLLFTQIKHIQSLCHPKIETEN